MLGVEFLLYCARLLVVYMSHMTRPALISDLTPIRPGDTQSRLAASRRTAFVTSHMYSYNPGSYHLYRYQIWGNCEI